LASVKRTSRGWSPVVCDKEKIRHAGRHAGRSARGKQTGVTAITV
jgi:hypothetical protein